MNLQNTTKFCRSVLSRGALAALALCVGGTSYGVEVLENDSIRIVFGDPEEGFAVKEIVSKCLPGGVSFVRTDGRRADFWELNFSCRNAKGDLWHERVSNRHPAKSRRVERDGNRIRFVYEGLDIGRNHKGVLDVVAEVSLDPVTGESRWNIAVEKVRRPLTALCHTEYPCLSCVMEPDAGDFMRPTKPHGMRVQKNWPGEGTGTQELQIPSCYLPVMAFMRQGGGISVAAHDPDARTKSVFVGPGTDVRFVTPVEDSGVAGKAAPGPGYAVTIRAFAGDWWRAADFYRDWALGQKWARKGLIAERGDFPSAMLDTDIWLRYNEDNAKAMSNHIERALATWPGLKLGIRWYYWHNSRFCVNFPEFYPPKAGVRQTIEFAKRKGVVMMPYVDVRLWDTNQVSWAYAKKGACVMEDGRTHGEVYTHTSFRRFHAIMCPSSDEWFETVRTVTDDALATGTPNGCGFNGIYYDQLSSASAPTCYDPRHGHPLGGGRWWTDRHRRIFSEIHDRLSAQNIPITAENAGDMFLDLVDGHLCCGYFAPDEVPFLQRVYSGRMLHFGSEDTNLEGPRDTFYARMARVFAFGVIPGNFDRYRLTDPKYAEQAAYVGAIARCRRTAREFLLFGELVGEARLLEPVPAREFDVVNVWRPERNCHVTMDVFRSTLWKARDGRLGLAVVNATAEPMTVRFEIPAAGMAPLAFAGMPRPEYAERDGVATLTLSPRAIAFLAQSAR